MKFEARLAETAGVAALFALLAAFAPPPAAAQTPLPVGPQALANVTTTADQDESAVAIDPDGNFVVVWRDALLDGSGSAIVGRRFDARTGLPLSPEFPVNFVSTGDQRNPAIAIAADGHFVVVWEGPDNPNPPFTPGIFGRLFEADGTPITSLDFPVNTQHEGLQRRPAVAMQPGGAFAVVWQDDTPPNLTFGGTGDNIRGRFFPENFPASPPSDPLFLNLNFDGDQEQPAVAALPASGLWMVGWQGPRQISPVIPMILVRVVNGSASGTGEFEMNTSGNDVQRAHLALAANDQGDAVAVWEAPDAIARGIFARRIVGGVPAGNEEAINLSTEMDEREPSVAIDQSGNFVTVWVASPPIDPPFDTSFETSFEPGPEGSPIIIQGRRRSGGGGFAEPAARQFPDPESEFEVSTSGAGFVDPWVANDPRGNFVVAWPGVDAADPEGNGVLYRGFRAPIFADGFDAGNSARWSATVP